MIFYIAEIQRQLAEVYGFLPDMSNVPDGDYPMTIDGKLDRVVIKDGMISCCNFEETTK